MFLKGLLERMINAGRLQLGESYMCVRSVRKQQKMKTHSMQIDLEQISSCLLPVCKTFFPPKKFVVDRCFFETLAF